MNLRNRIKKFIEEVSVKPSGFARNVGVSHTVYYGFMKGTYPLSETKQKQISEYLEKFGY